MVGLQNKVVRLRQVVCLFLCILLAGCQGKEQAIGLPLAETYIFSLGRSMDIKTYPSTGGLPQLEIKWQDHIVARATTGYFADNRAVPEGAAYLANLELLEERLYYTEDEYGLHIGSFISVEPEDWKVLEQGYQGETFYLETAQSNQPDDSEPPHQKAMYSQVELCGILQLAEVDWLTGEVYAEGSRVGNLFFFPYPGAMGDFPLIDMDGGLQQPKVIQSRRTNYIAAADTVRIKIGNFAEGSIHLEGGLTTEDILSMFTTSDLVQCKVTFSKLSAIYVYQSPVMWEATVSSITEIAPLA